MQTGGYDQDPKAFFSTITSSIDSLALTVAAEVSDIEQVTTKQISAAVEQLDRSTQRKADGRAEPAAINRTSTP